MLNKFLSHTVGGNMDIVLDDNDENMMSRNQNTRRNSNSGTEKRSDTSKTKAKYDLN